ncbi:MAG TPA: SDR family oxidoreductase, partial [Pseudogracilibacillus sp.]|nr:SDR family oxidoreductase [Pseudogracilibacillus sp.]
LPGMAHAGAARAGVVNLTKSLAYEWGEHGITVNAIAPGTIETSGLDQYEPEVIKQNMDRLPVSRLGTPLEVAQAAAYLLSPAGNFITGTTLEIDGGEHLLGAINQL